MKRLLLAALLTITALPPAFAADEQPTPQSIRQLLEATHARVMIDSAAGQMDAAIQASMKQAMQNKPVTAEQQQILDDMRKQMGDLFKGMMTWQEMEPIFVNIYANSFSQKEVDGMIAFYQSEIGKAVVEKLPIAMQYAMQAMQKRMGAMMPKIQELQEQTIAKLQATEKK